MAKSARVPARWWTLELDERGGKKIRCTLCPRECRLADGQAGFCFLRQREGDELLFLGYGTTTGFAVDPIEKKPLNHFLPGSGVLSFGTVGCNLGCRFCQNWDLSKARLAERHLLPVSADDVIALAQREGCPSIAMTYNDPVVWAEFAIDVARAARQHGLRSVLVTNGYVSAEARAALYRDVDAANVDLKAFNEEFYHRYAYGHLEPVLETLRYLRHETSVWIELTTLLVPGLNDSLEETGRLAEWIGRELGPDVPLHFTAFHPAFKMMDRPPTPTSTLRTARRRALEAGLRYVYTGNVADREGQTTWCPSCKAPVIVRCGYAADTSGLAGNACAACGATIAGRFATPPAR